MIDEEIDVYMETADSLKLLLSDILNIAVNDEFVSADHNTQVSFGKTPYWHYIDEPTIIVGEEEYEMGVPFESHMVGYEPDLFIPSVRDYERIYYDISAIVTAKTDEDLLSSIREYVRDLAEIFQEEALVLLKEDPQKYYREFSKHGELVFSYTGKHSNYVDIYEVKMRSPIEVGILVEGDIVKGVLTGRTELGVFLVDERNFGKYRAYYIAVRDNRFFNTLNEMSNQHGDMFEEIHRLIKMERL